jgi:hypothetical protein
MNSKKKLKAIPMKALQLTFKQFRPYMEAQHQFKVIKLKKNQQMFRN